MVALVSNIEGFPSAPSTPSEVESPAVMLAKLIARFAPIFAKLDQDKSARTYGMQRESRSLSSGVAQGQEHLGDIKTAMAIVTTVARFFVPAVLAGSSESLLRAVDGSINQFSQIAGSVEGRIEGHDITTKSARVTQLNQQEANMANAQNNNPKENLYQALQAALRLMDALRG